MKWFAAYDVSAAPQPLSAVCSTAFFSLLALTVVVLISLTGVESTYFGSTIIRALDEVTRPVRARVDDIFRAGTATFFICLWAIGGIIITPELKTTAAWIPLLQIAIAAGMFWRWTMPISALGIVVLYVTAVRSYGLFHLMDYPIFLGLAAYLAASGLGVKPLGLRPIDLARIAAGITLMWASIEKWAYPEWTYPLLETHPEVAFGFDKCFYMTAAGMVEFGLAFSLICTPLVRRLGALALAFMFVSAILEFGKIDAIGHLMIIVILLGVIADDRPAERASSIWIPARYCAALALFVAAYYGVHALFFGSSLI